MRGIVLAAGEGKRLRPLTDAIPKTLLGVDGDTSILDVALRNLAHVDVRDIAVVVGYRAEAVRERRGALERRHGVRIDLVMNDKASVWNNAYSLWLARESFADTAVLVNGDTVHPPVVEEVLLAARGPSVLLAIDDRKSLGDEEMKVVFERDGRLSRINKALEPSAAHGEYIGVTLIEAAAGPALADALEATWRRDPSLYYEDGYQEFAERGGRVEGCSVGAIEWVEVDDHKDLLRAKEIACRY